MFIGTVTGQGFGYAEVAMITVDVKFDLLICICTHMKSVKLLPSNLKQNRCVVVFENVKCDALHGLSPSYKQSNCRCLADGVRRGVGVQHLNRKQMFYVRFQNIRCSMSAHMITLLSTKITIDWH